MPLIREHGRLTRRAPLLTLALLLWSTPSLASAHPFTALFTKQYAGEGSDTFSACDLSGTFRLVVVNGPGRHHRVSSGSIVVNSVDVVGERDFNQRVGRIERRLRNVHSDNQLEVRLRGKPGSVLQVTIEGVQACGARITWPTPASTVTEPLVVVRGTVAGATGANVGVTVNGFAAHVEAGQFAAKVAVGPEVTSFTARAVDLSGELGSHSVPVSSIPWGSTSTARSSGRPR